MYLAASQLKDSRLLTQQKSQNSQSKHVWKSGREQDNTHPVFKCSTRATDVDDDFKAFTLCAQYLPVP